MRTWDQLVAAATYAQQFKHVSIRLIVQDDGILISVMSDAANTTHVVPYTDLKAVSHDTLLLDKINETILQLVRGT